VIICIACIPLRALNSHSMPLVPPIKQTLCDIGDVFTIPANIEKSFDQISNAIAHIASHGTMPIILGG